MTYSLLNVEIDLDDSKGLKFLRYVLLVHSRLLLAAD